MILLASLLKRKLEMKKVIAETCGQIDMAAWKPMLIRTENRSHNNFPLF